MSGVRKNTKRTVLSPDNVANKKKRRGRRKSSEDEVSDVEEVEQIAPVPKERTASEDFQLPLDILNSIIKEPGHLLFAGKVTWDLPVKEKSHKNLYSFKKFGDKKFRAAVSGCSSFHSVLLGEKGEVLVFGKNTCGQLGLGDVETRDKPHLVEDLRGYNIIQAATGKNHTLFLTDTGVVFACGDNRSGQCGVGSLMKNQYLTPTRINHYSSPIIKIACGGDYSLILDIHGSLYSFGHPEYGQLGHNTDGQYFATANKISYNFESTPRKIILFVEKGKNGSVTAMKDVYIVNMACGVNHSVAVDSKMRAFTWGFGGYGRLGHAEPKDEYVPRLLTFFQNQRRGIHLIVCGGMFTLFVNDMGFLSLCGQSKRSGECNMYPKPIQDLNGMSIRSLGAGNSSIVVAADESLISWGPSPTCGELGLGETLKSSTKPKEVRALDGVKISQVSMGHSHTLALCSDFSEHAVKALAKLDEFEF